MAGRLTKIRRDFQDFCERTGLHGYAYVVNGRNTLETVFWVVFCLAALLWTGQICFDALIEWEVNPTQTT